MRIEERRADEIETIFRRFERIELKISSNCRESKELNEERVRFDIISMSVDEIQLTKQRASKQTRNFKD